MANILHSCTHPRWFAASAADLRSLLSDHLHCERKAAENALSLVRRYPHRGASVTQLSRLAHEETSHVVQVAALLGRRGWTPRADFPNQYARGLMEEVRGREPELADFYTALGDAEERHAEIFLELARPLVDAEMFAARLEALGQREAEILGALPYTSRVH